MTGNHDDHGWFGLSRADAAAASLLLNLEAVFTAVIAWIFFREDSQAADSGPESTGGICCTRCSPHKAVAARGAIKWFSRRS
jgi:hypothetical protein